MRIASVIPEQMLSAIYRSVIPMQALAERGHTVHIEEHNELPNPEVLFTFDVVQMLQFGTRRMRRLARELKAAGVGLIWDSDDPAMAGSIAGGPGAGVREQAIYAGIAGMTKMADVVTTPSDRLADVFHASGAGDVRVIENHLAPTFTRPQRVMPHVGVTIGYFGSPAHHADARTLRVSEAIEKLLARHQHLEVISIGLDLGVRSRRYCHDGGRRYADLPLHLAHLDIGIAPLADTPDNHGRSDIKLKEYAALGVPWLASPIGPYAGMGEDQGGRLVEDDDWYERLNELVLDADARSKLARRGRRWAQEQTIEKHVDAWEVAFADAIAHASAVRATR